LPTQRESHPCSQQKGSAAQIWATQLGAIGGSTNVPSVARFLASGVFGKTASTGAASMLLTLPYRGALAPSRPQLGRPSTGDANGSLQLFPVM